MKKLVAITLSALLMLTVLTACGETGYGDTAEVKPVECSETLVVLEAAATSGSLADALKSLSDNGQLTYDGSESEYGFYLTEINGRAADSSKNEYWAVYTTLGEYEGAQYSNAEYGTYEYDGKKLSSASYGVSGLPMVEGELYIIVLETY